MEAIQTHAATGLITAIQEERFRFMTDQGESLLLTLPQDARVTRGDLARWLDENQRLEVEYTGEPNLTSGVALTLKPLE